MHRISRFYFTALILLSIAILDFGQAYPELASLREGWPEQVEEIKISSSLDGSTQPAIIFRAKGDTPRPLVISLHTWSENYSKKDTLSWQAVDLNFNYIHPDFRGKNNNFTACGSKYVIQDLDDAIQWCLDNMNVDTGEVHIIGMSGGGYATLLAYMNTKHRVKTFSAWVPVSDLEKWYYESRSRGTKYAEDIVRCTCPSNEKFSEKDLPDIKEARKRSPVYMEVPAGVRKNSRLYIYAGIHDGYTGSVPVTHSIDFYNRLAKEFDTTGSSVIPEKDIIEILSSRNYRRPGKNSIGDRTVHYEKTCDARLKILIFEGSHEMLPEVALAHVPSQKILTIGDSNGAVENGWVNQLRVIRFDDFIMNTSVSGNTIGFDNLGRSGLNTLRNIDEYMNKAGKELGGPDRIIIMLGTNDCKAVFADSLENVPENLEKLIRQIKSHPVYKASTPQIYIVSPPPFGKDEELIEKYYGGTDRIEWLFPRFKKVARKMDCHFIDTYHTLLPVWKEHSIDGIHLTTDGQIMLATMINEALEK